MCNNLFPQCKVSLSQQDKEEIIAEVMEKHQLARAIEVVNTALGFLTVNTWNKNAYLCRYVHEVLKFDENVFTTKVSRPCYGMGSTSIICIYASMYNVTIMLLISLVMHCAWADHAIVLACEPGRTKCK